MTYGDEDIDLLLIRFVIRNRRAPDPRPSLWRDFFPAVPPMAQ